MSYFKKTKVAVFVALLTGGAASVHAAQDQAMDDNRLQPDVNQAGAESADMREIPGAGIGPAGAGPEGAYSMQQPTRDTQDTRDLRNTNAVGSDTSNEQPEEARMSQQDADQSQQSDTMATTGRSSDLERENQQASNMKVGEKEDTVYFEFDSAELTSEAKEKLSQLVEDMKGKDEPLSITVAGHTDQTGPEPYNEDLAERRAEAVKEYLKQSELEVSSVDVRAVGESNPVSEDAAENRRVEIEPEGESEGLSATSAE